MGNGENSNNTFDTNCKSFQLSLGFLHSSGYLDSHIHLTELFDYVQSMNKLTSTLCQNIQFLGPCFDSIDSSGSYFTLENRLQSGN